MAMAASKRKVSTLPHDMAGASCLFQWKKDTKLTGFRVLKDNGKFGEKEVDASVLFRDVSRSSSKVNV